MSIQILSAERIQFIHDIILKNSPGIPGNREEASGAATRIQNHIDYENVSDIFEIAALYAISIAQGHVFNDGNKRTAFLSVYAFLFLNGYRLSISYDEHAVDVMIKIAQKEMNKNEIINWIKNNSHKIPVESLIIEEAKK